MNLSLSPKVEFKGGTPDSAQTESAWGSLITPVLDVLADLALPQGLDLYRTYFVSSPLEQARAAEQLANLPSQDLGTSVYLAYAENPDFRPRDSFLKDLIVDAGVSLLADAAAVTIAQVSDNREEEPALTVAA